MYSNQFNKKSRELLVNAFELKNSNILPVWFNYTLGNMKGLFMEVGTAFYYEVTYNKAKKEFYLDKYSKVENKTVKE